MSTTLSIILPCRNEESNLGFVLQEINEAFQGVDFKIWVVDNDSTDQSRAIASAIPGVNIVFEKQAGYGSALRAGFGAATGHWLLMMDADGTYPAREARKLFDQAQNSSFDLVLGDRLAGQIEIGAMPFLHRYVGTPVLSRLLRWQSPRLAQVKDCNSGLRILRRERLQTLPLRSQGMELASEMLIEAARADFKIQSFPIQFRKSPKPRRAHLRPLRDGLRHVQEIFRLRVSAETVGFQVRR